MKINFKPVTRNREIICCGDNELMNVRLLKRES